MRPCIACVLALALAAPIAAQNPFCACSQPCQCCQTAKHHFGVDSAKIGAPRPNVQAEDEQIETLTHRRELAEAETQARIAQGWVLAGSVVVALACLAVYLLALARK